MTSILPLILFLTAGAACHNARPVDTAPSSTPLALFEPAPQGSSDEALAATRRLDQAIRTPEGQIAQLSVAEHMRRADTYNANRAFAEARAHWESIIKHYPNDPNIPAVLFLMGRSYYQERRYDEALQFFDKLARDYAGTKEGREGFYFVAPTLLRLGRAAEAAARYRDYIERFPQGERIEDAYLNVIDTLREAGRPDEALTWIARTREKFAGTPTATNALFARLRLDVAASDWEQAVRTSDELRRLSLGRGVMTSDDEVAYLRAYSLERAGKTAEAVKAYLAIPDKAGSYYGSLATARLRAIGGAAGKAAAQSRAARVNAEIRKSASQYLAPYRDLLLRYAAQWKVDPRFVLAIMMRESNFNPRAKSPVAARGLLQLTMDTAQKYAPRLQLKSLREEDLYQPEISLQIGSCYLGELTTMFPNAPEAVAASYNGGEDNIVRWLRRAGHTDPGVFTAEVGFAETKTYVTKVLANYRAYCELYTADLRPRAASREPMVEGK